MKNSSPVIAYENRLVALIDVMGFRGLLKDTPEALSSLQSFYDEAFTFLFAKGEIYERTDSKDKFKKIFVSDSIILSVVLTDDNTENLQRAVRFFSAISLLQFVLATRALTWTRGSVSIGHLYIDQDTNVLVGPAFVQAYELEKQADYPRVIIDPRVCRFFETTSHEFVNTVNNIQGYNGKLISPNGPNWLDNGPLRHEAMQIDWFRQAFDRTENLEPFFKNLKNRMSTDQGLFQKSQRLLEYLRESCLLYVHSEFKDRSDTKRRESILAHLAGFGYAIT